MTFDKFRYNNAKSTLTSNKISFNSTLKTITISTGSFSDFVEHQYITITNSLSNNGLYRIYSLTTNVITLYDTYTLVTEAEGRTISLVAQLKEWDWMCNSVTEANEKFGIRCIYIPTEYSNKSLANGVYMDNEYTENTQIYLRAEGIETLGEDNQWTKFGYNVNNQIWLYGTVRQFDEIGYIPKKGDLVYSEDLNKKVFEVTNATYETKANKYPFGTPMSYMLTCKLHNPDMVGSYTSGNADVDTLDDLAREMKDRYDEEITDVIIDNDIIDTTETNPLDS